MKQLNAPPQFYQATPHFFAQLIESVRLLFEYLRGSNEWQFVGKYTAAADVSVEFFDDGIEAEGSKPFLDGYDYGIAIPELIGNGSADAFVAQTYEAAAWRTTSGLYWISIIYAGSNSVSPAASTVYCAMANYNGHYLANAGSTQATAADCEMIFQHLGSTSTPTSSRASIGHYATATTGIVSSGLARHRSTTSTAAATKARIIGQTGGSETITGDVYLYRRKAA